MKLSALPKNQKALIIKINLNKEAKERLHNLGLIKGVRICLVRSSPLKWPKIYSVLNTLVALRQNTADAIEIKND